MFWSSFFLGLEGFKEIYNPDPEIFCKYILDIAAFLETSHKLGQSIICDGKIKHVGCTYVD